MDSGGKRRALLIVAAPVTLALVWKLGLIALLRDPVRMHALVDAHQILGALLYLAGYTVISAIGVPGVFFLVPSALVFPKAEAFGLGMIGSLTSSWLAFGLTRSTFRSWVEPRVPKRLRRWDESIAKNELTTVITARLTFFLLPPVSWALGLTKVRTLPYLLGTAIGILPGVAFSIWAGGSFFDWLEHQPWWMWALFFGAIAVAMVVRRRRERASEAAESTAESSRPDTRSPDGDVSR